MHIAGADVIIASILVWFLGSLINKRIPVFEKFNIPVAVTGGFIVSAVIAFVYLFAGIEITFDLELRDQMILVFFATVGLTAKFRVLASGGKTLVILSLLTGAFLILQDLLGVGIASALGFNPGYGLFGGSVSFAGGFGTAVAWGDIAEHAGLEGATEVGIMFATLGLIVGGLLGGPLSAFLIKKHNLTSDGDSETEVSVSSAPSIADQPLSRKVREALGTLLVLAVCVGLGDVVNTYLSAKDVTLPGFLTAMLVAIIVTNVGDYLKVELSKEAVDLSQEVSLQLFLCASLMSMKLWIFGDSFTPVLLVTLAQSFLMAIFAAFFIFRMLGANYQAAVMTSGFVGLGLGATPVGIANMNAVTAKFGPAPKAFILVPLVGAFFLDLMNAAVIQGFLQFLK